MKATLEFLRYLSSGTTLLIGLACLYQWKRYRSAPSRWAAMAFGSISAITIAGLLLKPEPGQQLSGLYINLLMAVLVLFPYFLFRFTASFERPGKRLARAVDCSTVFIVAATLLLPGVPTEGAPKSIEWKLFSLALVAQWSFLFIVIGWKLWRAGRGQPRVPQRRMRLLAIATMGMTLSVIAGQVVPADQISVARLILRLMSLGSATMLFVGLAPPAWLLYLWRRKDTLNFQQIMGEVLSARSMKDLSEVLLPPTVSLIGARGAQLVSNTGELVGSTGITEESAALQCHEIAMRSGTLRLFTNAYIPFFARGELEMAAAMGGFADLAMERFVLADSQRESEAALAFQARHDTLTGLANRALFLNRLALALGRVSPGCGRSVTVQFLDLDRFKAVNDGIDHAAGDALLQAVAQRLLESVREEDLVARFGGDEFVVLAEVCDHEEALGLSGRLVAGLTRPFMIAGRELSISASVGVIVTDDSCDPDAVIRDADTAMYRAKESGRARVVLFDDELRRKSVERLELERSLRAAVSAGSLELYYQPMIRLSDEAVVGVEALFRWEHPWLGLMQAEQLIKLAEESDLIGELGDWVLRTACKQAAEWRKSIPGLPDLKVWINVSPAQFMYRDVAQDTANALLEAGVGAEAIGIEITETVFVEETRKVQDAFVALQSLGVSVAIDDFGTGYSSLGALKRFPVDILKVDGSFVKGLGDETQDTAIVAACIALGAAMGLTVIAESVETQEQADQLAEMGCAWAQGFHFSSPLPAAAAGIFLRSSCEAEVRDWAEEAEELQEILTKPKLTLVMRDSARAAV
ncbi:MAG TPA: EAL domain-containing protein [Acidimicrobiales bacterium]|nr:EAL domain-containing protein [Acidimicrobiales bacterium]